MRQSVRLSLSFTGISSLITILLFSGFITNFLTFTSKSLSTLFIDSLILFFFGHTLLELAWRFYNHVPVKKDYLYFTCFWIFLFLASLLKVVFLDTNPAGEKILGIRNNLLYCSFLVYIPLFFKQEEKNRAILNLILSLGILLCFFSFFQFAFSSKLPLSMLALRGEGVFSFMGEEFIRPTALLGNTIIFSSFTVILFSFFLIRYLNTKKRIYLILIGIVVTANVITYTRASLVGLALVTGTILTLKYGRFTLLFIIKGFILLSIALSSIVLIAYQFKDSFIVRRVSGTEASTVYSTRDHYNEIDASILFLTKKPLVGAGIGTQGPGGDIERKIITDGYWFQLFLEHGLILGFFFLIFYLSSVIYSLITYFTTENELLKELCISFLAFSVYFYLASFINSAIIGRVNQILYWVIFSMILAQQLIVKEKRNALFSN